MKDQKGFSLIELLIVVVIIGIFAAIAIPNLLASFTVTVDDIDYTYESDTPISSNITLGFNVSWTDADGGSHKGSIRILRPNEWLIKNRPNIPQ